MISDAAFTAISTEVNSRKASDGVFGEALALYQENYVDMKASNSALTPAGIERILLVPTTITSIVIVAERNFHKNALKATVSVRKRAAWKDAGANIMLGFVTNFLFLVIMLAFYLAAKDTAQSFFRSLGINEISEYSENSTNRREKELGDVVPGQRRTKPTKQPSDGKLIASPDQKY